MDKLLTIENISKAGCVGLLAIILITGYTKVWVYGGYYQEVVAERNEWRKMALDNLAVARKVSAAPVPVMGTGPQEPTLEDVKRQQELILRVNNK